MLVLEMNAGCMLDAALEAALFTHVSSIGGQQAVLNCCRLVWLLNPQDRPYHLRFGQDTQTQAFHQA